MDQGTASAGISHERDTVAVRVKEDGKTAYAFLSKKAACELRDELEAAIAEIEEVE